MTNKPIVVEITDYSSEGEGVARLPDGRVAFVELGVRGDKCSINITKDSKRFCRAKIVELIEPSVHRQEPDCPVFGKCGGCDFRHITREEELYAKQKRVNDAMKRIGGFDIEAEAMLAVNDDGYRNKITLAVAKRGERVIAGYRRKLSHDIIDISRCNLAETSISKRINSEKAKIKNFKNIPENVVIRHTEVEVNEFKFKFSKQSFFQVNTAAAAELYNKVREYASLSKSDTLLDLYCGAGTIALYLARDAAKVIGVDIEPAAIEDAKANALLNNVENAEFIASDAAEFGAALNIAPTCIVVDPPRGGLNNETVEKILALNPQRIVYVSCDPAALARDAKLLHGYSPSRLCAVDMFPRTAHIESVMLLS